MVVASWFFVEGDDWRDVLGLAEPFERINLGHALDLFGVVPSKKRSVLAGTFEPAARLRIPRNPIDSYVLLQ